MVICIGTDGNNLESQTAKRFGHSKYYILFNTETKMLEAIKNEDKDKHDHGILNNFFDKGAKIFIVGNVGPHAFEIMKSNGSIIYLARKMKAAEAISALDRDGLKELLEPTVKNSMNHGMHEHEVRHRHRWGE